MRGRQRTDIRDQRGFTLVELLVAVAVGMVVIGVPLTLLVQSFREQTRVQDVSLATGDAQSGLNRLLDDLRDSTAATVTATSAVLTVPVPVPQRSTSATAPLPPATTQVTWSCTTTTPGGKCTRTSGGETKTMIQNVTAVSFAGTASSGASDSTDPASVAVSVSVRPLADQDEARVPGGPSAAFVLQDSIDLRNLR